MISTRRLPPKSSKKPRTNENAPLGAFSISVGVEATVKLATRDRLGAVCPVPHLLRVGMVVPTEVGVHTQGRSLAHAI